MHWKCLPVPKEPNETPAMHSTTVDKVFARYPRWADAGALWQACVASVQHLAAEKHLDLRLLHGDGTITVAQKGAMGLGSRGTHTSKGRRSAP
jgi:hypothetical protein